MAGNRHRKNSRAFAIAQHVGRSLFLPIAILPPAGILLGIGSSFTNAATISAYGLSGLLHEGSMLFMFFQLLSAAGNAVFDNLALLFALAVAMGMAKREKGVAVLSSAIFYLIMLTTMNVMLRIDGSILADGSLAPAVKSGAVAAVLGIQTLQMGVFGGILAGMLAAATCNRFHRQTLPQAFAFFSGTRFVPIMCMVFGIMTGFVCYFFWPAIQTSIYLLGDLVSASGLFGTFIYGCIERALIPFGLHHIFYMPFWQTAVGGSVTIGGEIVEGAQNIFFRMLSDPGTVVFDESAKYLAGKYPFMMGGLPGAALAMYTCAKPAKKREAASLLLSVAMTSFLTGITEPVEFTFLFLAPVLYGVHVVFAGLSFLLCDLFDIFVGTSFSDGLIDFILYGVLPGNARTHWVRLVPLIAVYFVLYFIVFRTFILRRDLKTPGRGDDHAAPAPAAGRDKTAADHDGETAAGLPDGGADHAAAAETPGNKTAAGTAAGEEKAAGASETARNKNAAASAGSGNKTATAGGTVGEKPAPRGDSAPAVVLRGTGDADIIVKGTDLKVICGPSVMIVRSDCEDNAQKKKKS
ncbi:MAG: PTS transporter subunit EIIC [Eubacteriales bacterium]|nr:PTS transporter subunit EIIC [Eubacteriales bacterium]